MLYTLTATLRADEGAAGMFMAIFTDFFAILIQGCGLTAFVTYSACYASILAT